MARSDGSWALRIGDAERDATVEQLNEHFAAGRLTAREHDERTSLALTARTQADLDALLADLPWAGAEAPAGGRRGDRSDPRRGWGSGRLPAGGRGRGVRLALAAVLLVVLLHLLPVVLAVVVTLFVLRAGIGRRCAWHGAGRNSVRYAGWHGGWHDGRRHAAPW